MNNFDDIETYILGELEGERLQNFENELKINPDLQEAIKEHKALLLRLNVYKSRNLVKEITNQQKTQNRKRVRYLAAASIVLVLSIAGLYYFTIVEPKAYLSKSLSTDKYIDQRRSKNQISVYADTLHERLVPIDSSAAKSSNLKYLALVRKYSYQSDGNEFALRGEVSERETKLLENYKTADYKKVIDLYKKDNKHVTDQEQFIFALSLIKQDRFNEALMQLYKIEKNTGFTEELEWNILICKLANYDKNKNQINSTLKSIAKQPDHSFYKYALQLQRDLKEVE